MTVPTNVLRAGLAQMVTEHEFDASRSSRPDADAEQRRTARTSAPRCADGAELRRTSRTAGSEGGASAGPQNGEPGCHELLGGDA